MIVPLKSNLIDIKDVEVERLSFIWSRFSNVNNKFWDKLKIKTIFIENDGQSLCL